MHCLLEIDFGNKISNVLKIDFFLEKIKCKVYRADLESLGPENETKAGCKCTTIYFGKQKSRVLGLRDVFAK